MKLNSANKSPIISLIIEQLEKELTIALTSAENAHLAAVDDQSIAETQYDTLAIESAYLAQGHSKRVLEIKAAIAQYQQQLKLPANTHHNVKLNSLIEITHAENKTHYYYVGMSAGGTKVIFEKTLFTVITLVSPLGKALNNKALDDEFSFAIGHSTQAGFISNLC